jgi:hypothetical protein
MSIALPVISPQSLQPEQTNKNASATAQPEQNIYLFCLIKMYYFNDPRMKTGNLQNFLYIWQH